MKCKALYICGPILIDVQTEHAIGVAPQSQTRAISYYVALRWKAAQIEDFVDGCPQSTHKLSTKCIHKVKSSVFSYYFDFVDSSSLEIRI